MLKRFKPKLVFISKGNDESDAGVISVFTDRIPSILIVRWFDLFCFCFAMVSYIMDFFSDIVVAVIHLLAGRYLCGAMIFIFALLPSLVINLISFIWMLDDELHWKRRAHSRRISTVDLNQKRFLSLPSMIIMCLVQMGPLFWYYKALHYGLEFRKSGDNEAEKRRNFAKMVEAERDATLLRFFEAYLESAPQLIVQGTIVINYYWFHVSEELPLWFYFHGASLLFSTISISWSIVVQNRSLRMIRDDKINIWPHEAVLQFVWRFLTVFSRIMVLCITVSYFKINCILFLSAHLLVTMIHVVLFQAIHIDNCSSIEKLLLLINCLIHIFTPFNMAEGQTRYRYFTAYFIEFTEMSAIFYFLSKEMDNSLIINTTRCLVFSSFILGILIMCIYYRWFHPNIRVTRNKCKERENEEMEACIGAVFVTECFSTTAECISAICEGCDGCDGCDRK